MPDQPASRNGQSRAVAAPQPLESQDFAELDAILDDCRVRADETPQWEFCEGFMVALICCRRSIAPAEFLPVLLELDAPGDALEDASCFADSDQEQRFMALWSRRWDQIAAALDCEIESLQEDRAYQPEVLDTRGAVAALPEPQRAELLVQALPAFAQVWALGFMFAVESWPEEWRSPREREAARLLDASIQAIVALTEDDTETPTVSMCAEEAPPSVSAARMDRLALALWAAYDLRALWRGIGPRVLTVRRTPRPGRNDPCPCGSGRKYKKCHGGA